VKSVIADLDDFDNDFLNLAQHAVLRVEHRRTPEPRGGGERVREFERLQPVVVGANRA
jgi:hypothetical protein